MKTEEEEARDRDRQKLDDLAYVCAKLLDDPKLLEAARVSQDLPLNAIQLDHRPLKKNRLWGSTVLPLPAPTVPAISDFPSCSYRCEKKPSSTNCDSASLDHASKKLKLEAVFSRGDSTMALSARSSTTPSTGESVVIRSWMHAHALLGATPPIRIGEKLIKGSDTNGHQSRLLIPLTLVNKVLQKANDSERAKINSDGLSVMVLDQRGQQHKMTCKFRASQNGMVFTGGWNAFVEANHLRVDDKLLILSFRYRDELSFAFVFDI